MKPRFLLDEQLSQEVATAAANLGLDVEAVSGSDLTWRDDEAILHAAVAKDRILVTIDIRGFLPKLVDALRDEVRIPGLILVNPRTFPSQELRPLLRALKKMADRIEHGEVDPSMGVVLTR